MKTDERIPPPEDQTDTDEIVSKMIDTSRSIAVSHVVMMLILAWVLGAFLHECGAR